MKTLFPFPTLNTVRAYLRATGRRAKRSLGQNFLVDRNTAERIVDLFGDLETATVLEIGPGMGAFTCLIAPQCLSLTAVELDRSLSARLARQAPDIQVIEGNILKIEPGQFAKDENVLTFGNLPFNLSVKILKWWIEAPSNFKHAYFIFQDEVANRLVARRSTSSYGSLTLLISFTAMVRKIKKIPPTVFFPQPEVSGSLVALTRRESPQVTVPDAETYFRLIEEAFAYRRKTLANSLKLAKRFKKQGSQLKEVICRCGFPETVRAEELVADDFAVLLEALDELALCQER